jgi:hypothetical protein
MCQAVLKIPLNDVQETILNLNTGKQYINYFKCYFSIWSYVQITIHWRLVVMKEEYKPAMERLHD